MLLEGKDIAVYGSQGENRLASIALKLTPYFLIENPAKKPLAVLDDIYSELDAFHAERLTELIQSLGQAFVTSAEATISGAATIDVAMHHATIGILDGKIEVHFFLILDGTLCTTNQLLVEYIVEVMDLLGSMIERAMTCLTMQETREVEQVCLFPFALNGEILTNLWTPFSAFK